MKEDGSDEATKRAKRTKSRETTAARIKFNNLAIQILPPEKMNSEKSLEEFRVANVTNYPEFSLLKKGKLKNAVKHHIYASKNLSDDA